MIQIYKCDYCKYTSENKEDMKEHELTHIQSIDIKQIKSDGSKVDAKMNISELNGNTCLTFVTETEETRRSYKYEVSDIKIIKEE